MSIPCYDQWKYAGTKQRLEQMRTIEYFCQTSLITVLLTATTALCSSPCSAPGSGWTESD